MAKYILFWLLVSVALVFLLGHLSSKDAMIAERERVVTGTIVALHLGTCIPTDYTFQFEGKVFNGTGCGKGLRVSVGLSTDIFIDPLDPKTNGLHSFKSNSAAAHDLRMFAVYLSIGLAVVSVVLWLDVLNR